jgi:formate dehydrogenase maturation protein FdhE
MCLPRLHEAEPKGQDMCISTLYPYCPSSFKSSGIDQVRLEIFVGARIGHCGLCYGRWEEVRRESLLSSVIPVVVVVP